ncbi:MAG: hypothetical protein ISP90_01695 [Nevskia sp.]|nr:hypothetical protein [Nevskia sp.]
MSRAGGAMAARRRQPLRTLAGLVAAAGMAFAAVAQAPPAPPAPAPRAAQRLLLGIAAAGDRLVSVGARGAILVSSDAQAWQEVDVPLRSDLTAVSFADAGAGWAVGHDAAILRTTDGGRSWTVQRYRPEAGQPLLDVLALDRDRAYAVGAHGLFLQTQDGGAHWAEVQAPVVREAELNLYGIRRLGKGALLVFGEQGRLAWSVDDGRSWRALKSPTASTIFGAAALADGGLLLCGAHGNAFIGTDPRRGAWRKLDTGGVQALFACGPAGAGRLVLLGAGNAALLLEPGAGTASRIGDAEAAAAGLDAPTYSGFAPWRGELVTVGSRGVRRMPLPAPTP